MSITLAASVNDGVYIMDDYTMVKQNGYHLKTEYFYESLNDLTIDDGIIYASFDCYGTPRDKELLELIEKEYGIRHYPELCLIKTIYKNQF